MFKSRILDWSIKKCTCMCIKITCILKRLRYSVTAEKELFKKYYFDSIMAVYTKKVFIYFVAFLILLILLNLQTFSNLMLFVHGHFSLLHFSYSSFMLQKIIFDYVISFEQFFY